MDNNILLAFSLTLLAGLSTGIGGLIVFFAKRSNVSFLAFSLGLSAGVMIYVSFVEMLPSAVDLMLASKGEQAANIYATLAFFAGILAVALIDRIIPDGENPHEARYETDNMQASKPEKRGLMRTGVLTALALAIHNFPEGMVTFMSALQDIRIAIPIAIAIAIHNIPEGIAVSIPIAYATGSKKKAFLYSLFSGLAEPAGALLAYLVLKPFLSDSLLGLVYGAVAGIMVFVSLDELLPSADKFGKHHVAIYGLVIGMALMALSLIII